MGCTAYKLDWKIDGDNDEEGRKSGYTLQVPGQWRRPPMRRGRSLLDRVVAVGRWRGRKPVFDASGLRKLCKALAEDVEEHEDPRSAL